MKLGFISKTLPSHRFSTASAGSAATASAPALTGRAATAVTENKRFKEGGVWFLGCLPVYDYDASLLKSGDLKRDRALEIFHDCITVLASELKIACKQNHKIRTSIV